MRILLSNDDGVHAPGLEALYSQLSEIGEVVVVAPDRNLSGASSALTLTNPLRLQKHKNGFHSVNGTPTDCVHLAINQLMKDNLPDIVVAGVNHGANLGDDTFYSGTVSAAAEGRHMGLPAVAVSLVSHEETYLITAAKVAKSIVQHLLQHPIPSDQILNVNVPSLPYDNLNGFEVTRLGQRHKAEMMEKQQDPWGREIYWYGKLGAELDAGPGTDFNAIKEAKVSITPLKIDMTAFNSIETVSNWIEKLNN
jgi:5'-nucleotidase